MIRCQKCNKITESSESTHEIISEKRQRTYRNALLKGKLPDQSRQITFYSNNPDIIDKYVNEYKFEILKEWKTEGWEIQKTLRVCKECFITYRRENATHKL